MPRLRPILKPFQGDTGLNIRSYMIELKPGNLGISPCAYPSAAWAESPNLTSMTVPPRPWSESHVIAARLGPNCSGSKINKPRGVPSEPGAHVGVTDLWVIRVDVFLHVHRSGFSGLLDRNGFISSGGGFPSRHPRRDRHVPRSSCRGPPGVWQRFRKRPQECCDH